MFKASLPRTAESVDYASLKKSAAQISWQDHDGHGTADKDPQDGPRRLFVARGGWNITTRATLVRFLARLALPSRWPSRRCPAKLEVGPGTQSPR